MTSRTLIQLTCDDCGCSLATEPLGRQANLKDSRLVAASRGWLVKMTNTYYGPEVANTRKGPDYCPKCKEGA